MTTPEIQDQPPLPLPQFLAEAAAFFSAWQEDFADYAEDYYNDEEEAEREAELERVNRLTQAAAYWADRYPTSPANTE